MTSCERMTVADSYLEHCTAEMLTKVMATEFLWA